MKLDPNLKIYLNWIMPIVYPATEFGSRFYAAPTGMLSSDDVSWNRHSTFPVPKNSIRELTWSWVHGVLPSLQWLGAFLFFFFFPAVSRVSEVRSVLPSPAARAWVSGWLPAYTGGCGRLECLGKHGTEILLSTKGGLTSGHVRSCLVPNRLHTFM